MSSDFKAWFMEKIEALTLEREKIQSEIDRFQGLLEEYEASQSRKSNLFDGAKQAPSAALLSIFDKSPEKEFSTKELKSLLGKLKESNLLDSKPERTVSAIMHAGLNNLVKRGLIWKAKPAKTPKGPAYYIRAPF